MSVYGTESEQFYEHALCWLGRSRQVYRLLSEAVMPPVSTWVRGDSEARGLSAWQPSEIRTFLFPVVNFSDRETGVLTCEALLLCGNGNYYNPCDAALVVFVQRPQEAFSQLLQRIRQTEAMILRAPEIAMTTEHVSLSKRGQDYINTRYLIWPYQLSEAMADTLTAQAFCLITFAPQLLLYV